MINNTSIDTVKVETQPQNLPTKPSKVKKEDDTVFARSFRNIGMERCADFFRDDWSANTARKMGLDNFADWIDNKPDENGEKDEGVLSNFARKMVKHPFLTISLIVGTAFAGKAIYNSVAKNKANIVANATPKTVGTTGATRATVVSAIDSSPRPPQVPKIIENLSSKPINEQIDELTKIVAKGLNHERNIEYKDLEIFENLTLEQRRSVISMLQYQTAEKEFLSFATGNQSIFFLGGDWGKYSYLDGVKIKATTLMGQKRPNFLINTKKAREIIDKNREFIIHRFNMTANTTTDEILSTFCGNINNRLNNRNQFADIIELLCGATEKNAIYSQIYQDLSNAEKYIAARNLNTYSVYNEAKKGFEAYKTALKKFISSDKSSYKNMPEKFKQKVLDIIDSLKEQDYEYRALGAKDFFNNEEYLEKKLKVLKDMAIKLINAETYGAKIKL